MDLNASTRGGLFCPTLGPWPPTFDVVKKVASKEPSKSFSSIILSSKTEPTIPLHPTNPTYVTCKVRALRGLSVLNVLLPLLPLPSLFTNHRNRLPPCAYPFLSSLPSPWRAITWLEGGAVAAFFNYVD
eukprot:758914-Hanusia_phi.AAC.4